MAEKKNNEQQLYVQKEPFEYNGKMYNHYYIKGVVRGREVKIDLAPPNKAGHRIRRRGQGRPHHRAVRDRGRKDQEGHQGKPLYRPHGGRGRQSLRMHGKALAHVGQVAS